MHGYTASTVPTPAVPPTASPHLVDLRDLRLETAQALVGASAQSPEAAAPERYLQELIDGLCELSLKDPLTGLANRRYFLSVLEREIDRVARSGESALLLLLDIDHFKTVNDTHGHIAGDRVLQDVARTLSTCVRPMDTLARYGGEEFAVVLPGCQAAFGHIVAERIRMAIEKTPVRIALPRSCISPSVLAAPLHCNGYARLPRCGSIAPTCNSTRQNRPVATVCILKKNPAAL